MENGAALRAVSPLSGDGAHCGRGDDFYYMLKSAAWEAMDIRALENCLLLRASHSDGAVSDYYAFLLDGRAVLQSGPDGRYSYIDDGLYARLLLLAQTGAQENPATGAAA
jgi:hypothetical protein